MFHQPISVLQQAQQGQQKLSPAMITKYNYRTSIFFPKKTNGSMEDFQSNKEKS